MAVAFVYRSGEIGFGDQVAEGCLAIAQGDAMRLRTAVQAVARHAYDGQTLLVPGVPEADDDNDALNAVHAFCRRVHQRMRRRS